MFKDIFVISKNDANLAKGVAILLMLFHHLFAFPERYQSLDIDIHSEWVQSIALWSKICVPVFLYLSGFAFSKLNYNASNLLLKLTLFLKKYWFVCSIFIPLGLMMSKIDFEPKIIISHILTISSRYNGEWWFVKLYVELLLLLVIITYFNVKTKIVFLISLILFIYIQCFPNLSLPFISAYNLFYWQFPFFLGYLISELVKKKERHYLFILFLISIIFGIGSFLFNDFICLIFFTPLLIFLSKSIGNIKKISGFLIFAGKYSMFVWLVHTFYCYYFFPEYIYNSNYILVIYLTLVFISFSTSIVLEFIYSTILKKYNNNSKSNHNV